MTSWLVVIDPQVIFADPASPWAAPRFAEALPAILELITAHAPRVVITRWVPPTRPVGSWRDYLDHWSFADRPAGDPVFDLVAPLASLPAVRLDCPTFSKWPQLAGVTGELPHLELAGVATDCCVISTALAAADAGARVTVHARACAASSDQAQQAALSVLAGYHPQIDVRQERSSR